MKRACSSAVHTRRGRLCRPSALLESPLAPSPAAVKHWSPCVMRLSAFTPFTGTETTCQHEKSVHRARLLYDVQVSQLDISKKQSRQWRSKFVFSGAGWCRMKIGNGT